MKKVRFAAKNLGMGLVELMVYAGIGSLVTVAVGTVLIQASEDQASTQASANLAEYRQQLISVIANDTAWQTTIEDLANEGSSGSPKLDCLVDATPCTANGAANGAPIANQAFVLYDMAGNVFYDSTVATSGITSQGTACNTYVSTGNDACPFRYNLVWSASCPVGSCTLPMVKITATLQYSPATRRLPINPANYSINVYYRLPVLTVPSCGGVSLAGFCWYLSGANESCQSACSTRGGYNNATRNYIGSRGTDANCRAVATAVGVSALATFGAANNTSAAGCRFDSAGNTLHRDRPRNTRGNYALNSRICACNN